MNVTPFVSAALYFAHTGSTRFLSYSHQETSKINQPGARTQKSASTFYFNKFCEKRRSPKISGFIIKSLWTEDSFHWNNRTKCYKNANFRMAPFKTGILWFFSVYLVHHPHPIVPQWKTIKSPQSEPSEGNFLLLAGILSTFHPENISHLFLD